jgi:hypothetical protein
VVASIKDHHLLKRLMRGDRYRGPEEDEEVSEHEEDEDEDDEMYLACRSVEDIKIDVLEGGLGGATTRRSMMTAEQIRKSEAVNRILSALEMGQQPSSFLTPESSKFNKV